jgi:hypothetical protein
MDRPQILIEPDDKTRRGRIYSRRMMKNSAGFMHASNMRGATGAMAPVANVAYGCVKPV